MDGNWISAQSIAAAASASSEGYDDIRLLLAHTQLDGFAYQSFRERGAPRAVTVASASAQAHAAQPAPAETRLASDRPPAAAASNVSRLATPRSSIATMPVEPRAATGAAFSTLFERLAGNSAAMQPARPRLELHLPSRPLAPRKAAAGADLISLPAQRAFARLGDAVFPRLARAI